MQLGAGYYTTGALRSYDAGIPAMQFTLKNFIKYNNQNYTRIQCKTLDGSNNVKYTGYIYLDADDIDKNTLFAPETILTAGNYKWFYSTKIDGVTYSGFYMNPVYLYTI